MTPRLLPAILRDRRGSAAVEAAFVLPVLLLFMLMIFEGGRLMWIKASVMKAATVAARCNSLESCNPSLAAEVNRVFAENGVASGPASVIGPVACNAGEGQQITVRYDATTVAVPLVSNLIGNSLTLTETVCYPVAAP